MDAKIAHGIVSKRVCLEAPVHSDTEGNNQPVGANRAHNAQVTTAVNLSFALPRAFADGNNLGAKRAYKARFQEGVALFNAKPKKGK
jgi:hypothetical protein